MESENIVTISTHNGSQVALDHNRRKPSVIVKEPHIDPDGHFEIWRDFDPRKAYQEIFGQALQEFNNNQTDESRKIKDYYSHICKDKKKHPIYEMIVGVYGKKEDGTPVCSKNDGKRILRAFVEDWERRNPNLVLVGAYYHCDESAEINGTPAAGSQVGHLHLDYIPKAEFDTGLKIRSSLARALQQQGFKAQGQNTEQIQWQARENQHLGNLCARMGFVVHHPGGKEHLDTATYKKVKELQSIQEKEQAIAKSLEEKKLELEIVQDEIHSLRNQKTLSETVMAVLDKPYREFEIEHIPAQKKTLTKPEQPPKVVMLEKDYKELRQQAETVSWIKRALEDLRAVGARLTRELNQRRRVAELQAQVQDAEQAVRAAQMDLSYAKADIAAVQEENLQQQKFMESIKTRTGRSIWELFIEFITKEREHEILQERE